jgi:phosphoribosylamine--glycine ligase
LENDLNILVVGGGGREHALVWKLKQSAGVKKIFASPGNPGIAQLATCSDDLPEADLTIVGPEAPLVAGIVDRYRAAGREIVGPSAAAAQLEGSKIFAKELMNEAGIPTARYAICEDRAAAQRALPRFEYPLVIKADGLAAGKGVVIVKSRAEAEATLDRMLAGELVGDAGRRVVLEDFCPGEEVSFIAISDGETVLPLAATQDHKQVFDGDQGPNTGGMGAYCDDRILTASQRGELMDLVMRPAVYAMAKRGTPFTGFLFAGIMMTAAGPKVLEFNVRLGDPETQALMHRLDGDLGELMIAAAEGRLSEVQLRWKPEPSVCVVMCAANYPGEPRKGDEILGIENAEEAGAIVFQAGTALREDKLVTNGGRVLGVTASGATLDAARVRTYDAVSKIRFAGSHYRRDIAAKGLKRW